MVARPFFFFILICRHTMLHSRLGLYNTPTASPQRGKTPPKKKNKCSEYDIKQSDSKASVMLKLWGMRNTRSLASISGPL